MAKGYRPVDRDQPFLFPPDMREWLPAGDPVWLVIEAVSLLDTSAFHAGRKTGGAGAAGYDPDMMVTLLIWAYANGVTSSRRIERLCARDVAFRVICAGHLPDHVTIARFRQQFADTAVALFAQVLVLCARLGMGQVGTVAVDGTKIAASASADANRTEEGLRKLAAELAARHAETDAAEDALFGDGRGDDDPGDPHTRRERVAAALASLEAERERREAEAAADRARAAQAVQAARAGTPVRGMPPAGTEVTLAAQALARARAEHEARAAAWHAAAAAGRRPRGKPPVPTEDYTRVRAARTRLERAQAREAARQAAAAQKDRQKTPPVRNVTDPGSRLMPVRGGGFIQGYNAQNVASGDGLIIATRLTDDTTDTRWYEPMTGDAAAAAAAMAAARDDDNAANTQIGLVLADAGYLSEANLTCDGPDRLIATGKRRDLERRARQAAGSADRPGPGGVIAAMAARLATEEGIAAYRQRGRIAETPHGRIKHNMRLRQLSVRGMRKAAGEWTFACAVHNLMMAITSGHLTTRALAGLAG
jgi:transposase